MPVDLKQVSYLALQVLYLASSLSELQLSPPGQLSRTVKALTIHHLRRGIVLVSFALVLAIVEDLALRTVVELCH